MMGTSTHITQVGTVIVPVSDQDRALEFYVGKLGFEKRLDAPFGEGGRWVEVAPPGAATTIALVAGGAVGGAGMEVSFATSDAEADHKELRARGVEADAELIRMGDFVPPDVHLPRPGWQQVPDGRARLKGLRDKNWEGRARAAPGLPYAVVPAAPPT